MKVSNVQSTPSDVVPGNLWCVAPNSKHVRQLVQFFLGA